MLSGIREHETKWRRLNLGADAGASLVFLQCFHISIFAFYQKEKKVFVFFFPARTHLENNKTRLSKVDTLIKRQRARNLQSILLRKKKTLMNRITRNTFKTGSLASEVDSGGVVTIWDMYHTEWCVSILTWSKQEWFSNNVRWFNTSMKKVLLVEIGSRFTCIQVYVKEFELCTFYKRMWLDSNLSVS